MVCRECGSQNKDDALNCAHCGDKLDRSDSPKNVRTCPQCEFENPHDGKYCARCGAELQQRHNGHQHQPNHGQQAHQKHQKKNDRRLDTKHRWRPGLVTIILLAGIFVLIMSVELFVKKQPAPPPQLVETRSIDAKLEATVMEIASKFICSCGTCGEKPLDICKCNKAAEERQFIRNYLEQGQKPDQVIIAVNNTYGWIKPEFEALVGETAARNLASVKSNLRKAPFKGSVPVDGFQEIDGNSKLATVKDRLEIFSHFHCQCGQCGIDELKDCDCRHPKGATEVKGFVDVTIAEGQYTVAQVINMLDDKYGGRKY